jgi:hypothetical protein
MRGSVSVKINETNEIQLCTHTDNRIFDFALNDNQCDDDCRYREDEYDTDENDQHFAVATQVGCVSLSADETHKNANNKQ